MRLGHELPLQPPEMGLSQSTGWGREWERGNGPWGFWILCAAIIAACSATSKRGFSSHFFQVWGAESSWDFPPSFRAWQGRGCPGPALGE